MKTKLIFFLACMLLLAICACDDDDKKNDSLNGTQWKLTGVVDIQTGILKELEPKDCKECYTLMFETNTLASGLSISEDVSIDLSDLRKYTMTGFGEIPDDGNTFREILFGITSYSITPYEMKLFNNKHNNYLLFKKIEL